MAQSRRLHLLSILLMHESGGGGLLGGRQCRLNDRYGRQLLDFTWIDLLEGSRNVIFTFEAAILRSRIVFYICRWRLCPGVVRLFFQESGCIGALLGDIIGGICLFERSCCRWLHGCDLEGLFRRSLLPISIVSQTLMMLEQAGYLDRIVTDFIAILLISATSRLRCLLVWVDPSCRHLFVVCLGRIARAFDMMLLPSHTTAVFSSRTLTRGKLISVVFGGGWRCSASSGNIHGYRQDSCVALLSPLLFLARV